MADVQQVANFLQVDAAVVEGHDWAQILPSLLLRAAEYEHARSRNVVLEVEVEQAHRQAEKRINTYKAQLDASLSERDRLQAAHDGSTSPSAESKTRLEQVEKERSELREQVLDLTTQTQRLSDEKRQALALVDRQSQQASRYEEEYKSLSERYQTLRKDTANLESQMHEARSTASSAQFKQQSTEQELTIAQKNADWLNGELSAKTADFSKYRKETGTLLTTLQQECDAAKTQSSSLEVSSDALRRRNDELSASLDQTLLKVQDLQDQLVTKEESFRNEMATSTRLIELHERSAKDAKARIHQLERSVDQRASSDSSEVLRWKQLYEDSHARIEQLESQLGEVEADMDRIQSELAVANERMEVSNGTPKNGIGLLSPSAQVISKVQNSGMSLTQLYSEYLKTMQDLEHERRKNAKIQKSFDNLIQELEARAPQLQEQREEYSQLQLELATMSEDNQSLSDAKIEAQKELSKANTNARDQAREITLYRQQVNDLSRQVQKLLFEIEEQGFRANPLSEAEVTALNRMLEDGPGDSSAVHNLISERLVLFKSIQEMQQQNQQQLKVTRQLGAKMEREEEENRTKLADIESSALSEANEVITSLNAEIRSMQIKMDSYIRERDMFRRMLTTKEQQTAVPITTGATAVLPDTSEALGDLQAQFDTYKNETSINQKTLSDQLAAVNKERSELHLQVARVTSHLELAEERYKMSQGAADSMRKEVEETRKRGSQIQEALSKQDIRTQQIAEELVENKSLLEGLRAESANLKAEKQLWKTIEQRMTDELESLRQERQRSNNLVANLQALQSERERSDSELSQRHNHQLQSLQTELDSTKTRLNDEREEVRRMTLNKEQSSRESQEKIESLLRQVSDAREAHAVASTEKERYKSRTSELDSQLQAAQEKVAIFIERAGTPAAGSEQQLQIEIADLQLALENAKSDSKQAELRAEKMQQIAAAAEEALQTMNKSHDEFSASAEAQIVEKQKVIDSVNQRVQDLVSELETANQELGEIRSAEMEKRQDLQRELDTLRERLVGLQEIEEKYNMANAYYQDDLRSQAEIAQEAQQNYENELVRHAEAAQSLRTLRQDYNELRTEVITLRREAETNESRLSSDSIGWQNQKDLYERELSELRSRLSDMQRQNELLHNQFETFTSQMSHRSEQSTAGDVPDPDSENVQEIIKYLRREKEIVDVSYEVLQQENKRTKQQLTHMTKALDDLQSSLAVERQKTAQMTANTAQHGDVLAKMTELNLTRESNVALRAENESNLSKVRDLEGQLRQVSTRIEPLEVALRTLEAESHAKTEEISLLLQDNERWKQRNQSILQKYERIDPAELQELREKAAGAEAQAKDALENFARELKEKEDNIANLQEQATIQSSKYDALMQQSRERIKKERTDAKKAMATAQDFETQVAALTEQIAALKSEVEDKASQTSAADIAKAEELQARINALETQIAEKDESLQTQATAATNDLAEARALVEKLTQERDSALATKDGPSEAEVDTNRVTELETELSESKAELEKQKSNFSKLRAAAKKNKDELQSSLATITELQTQLDSAKSGTTDSPAKETEAGISEEDVQKRIKEALASAITEEDVQARIAAAIANQSAAGTTDDDAVQERIDEALAQQAAVNEDAIQQRIDSALSKAKEENTSADANEDTEHRIEEIVKAKDEEMKVKIRNITKERVDQIVEQRLPKKIETEKQAWLQEAEAQRLKALEEKEEEKKKALEALEADVKERLKAHGESVRKESTMRVTLQMKSKDKEIAALQKKIAELSAATKEDETDNGKIPNLFDDISEHSQGDLDEGQASGTETVAASGIPTASSNGSKSRGRGGKQSRLARRGGHQGTKRVREDNESEQPAKKAAS